MSIIDDLMADARHSNGHDCLDKPDSRRARLTAEIAAQVSATHLRGGQVRKTLAQAYARAHTAGLWGDPLPAEALRDCLRAYVPALRDHRFGRRDWTALSLAMYEMRLLRATQALCEGGEGNDE
jgi:hypothetical protein